MVKQLTDRLKKLSKKQIGIITAVLLLIVLFVWRQTTSAQQAPQYQTATVERGTLITSVSASGTVSSGSNASITTTATGTVTNVYAKPGDVVTEGQTLAEISLDATSQQKQAAAWAAYLSAKNTLDSANASLYTKQSDEFVANQKFMNDAVAKGLSTSDPTYVEENAQWLAAEAAYKNQQSVIAQAQAAVTSAWLSYQQLSPDIVAPASGVLRNFSLSTGLTLVNNSSQSSANAAASTAQTIGTISLENSQVQAIVNLSEIDVTKVQPGQKVTLTLDAFPDKTFTGKVLSIDTSGTVSSGVTTYPATIAFDSAPSTIYPNMAVTAKIITNIIDNVLLVPSTAIVSQAGASSVRVMKNGKVQLVDVALGESNDTDTVVTSGLSEGDSVVTSVISKTTAGSRATSSPFGGGFGGGGIRVIGGNAGFGGGGARRGQ